MANHIVVRFNLIFLCNTFSMFLQYGHSIFNGADEVPSGCYSTHILLKSGSCIVEIPSDKHANPDKLVNPDLLVNPDQLVNPDLLVNPDQLVKPEIPLNLAATANCALATMTNAISTFESLRKALKRNKSQPSIGIIVRLFKTALKKWNFCGSLVMDTICCGHGYRTSSQFSFYKSFRMCELQLLNSFIANILLE